VRDEEPRADPVTIVLADDHTVLRNGLRMLLDAQEGFEVVGEAGTIPQALEAIRAHRPRVLLLDLNMPGGSSIDAIPTVTRISSGTVVVMLTMETSPSFMAAAYDAGARGYTRKEAAAAQLISAIREALEPPE